jgi:hypothetical protein
MILSIRWSKVWLEPTKLPRVFPIEFMGVKHGITKNSQKLALNAHGHKFYVYEDATIFLGLVLNYLHIYMCPYSPLPLFLLAKIDHTLSKHTPHLSNKP